MDSSCTSWLESFYGSHPRNLDLTCHNLSICVIDAVQSDISGYRTFRYLNYNLNLSLSLGIDCSIYSSAVRLNKHHILNKIQVRTVQCDRFADKLRSIVTYSCLRLMVIILLNRSIQNDITL